MTDTTKLANALLQELYNESEPSADYDDVADYSDHYLPKDREVEIIEEFTELYDLDSDERATIVVDHVMPKGPRTTPMEDEE